MHVLRLVGFAGIALLLVSGCVHISDGPGGHSQHPQPPASPPPPLSPMDQSQQAEFEALKKALCSVPSPGGGPITYRITVRSDGTIDPSDKIIRMRRKDRVLWSMTPTDGTKLTIKPFDPKKIILKESDWETEGKPKEKGDFCNPLSYDIVLWVNGEPIIVDPILIIRD